jgi:trimeric autotransporter adhesin
MKRSVPNQFLKLPILLLLTLLYQDSFSQIADYGKSYFNVSKGVNGGTVEPGDTLEIRASFVVRNAGFFDSCAFFDAVPAGTAYVAGTIRVLTNEGKIYKQFTDIQYGPTPQDEGWISGSNVRINLGYNQTDAPARVFRRGRIRNTHKPSFYNSSCIMVASYRVRVTAGYGTIINMGGGSFTYRLGANPITTVTLPANNVMVYLNLTICPNSVGANSLGAEFNGTFGSGKPRNRGTSANVPPSYTYAIFDVNTPNDYYYGISNNTSTRQNYTTLNTWAKPDPSSPTHRVFNVWDIIGDHTGAASPTLGNPAADTVNNNNGGYMLVVNSAYRIDSAFQHVISNLCPNTYYEISCWLRNICSKCGCDSNGRGASGGAGYIPTAAGDSSGVYPSLIFEIDGVDYYSSGQLRYTGEWVKKAFTFLTGPAQTSLTLKFNNNAPGGGGNDWALDDISVATCSPDVVMTPSQDPFVCDSNLVDIGAIITSYFNNYTYYKWRKSTDGGVTWFDVGSPGGPATPVWNGSAYEYSISYPSFVATMADSGDMYQVIIATTSANLSDPNCSIIDSSKIITLNVSSCSILNVSLTSFDARLTNDHTTLQWSTSREEKNVMFDIERSIDGVNFTVIKRMYGANDPGENENDYVFTDPELTEGTSWYRIKMIDMMNTRNYKYTGIKKITVPVNGFKVKSIANPFKNDLQFEITSDHNSIVNAELLNFYGEVVAKRSFTVSNGRNLLSIPNLGNTAPGIYTLRISTDIKTISKKLVKLSR